MIIFHSNESSSIIISLINEKSFRNPPELDEEYFTLTVDVNSYCDRKYCIIPPERRDINSIKISHEYLDYFCINNPVKNNNISKKVFSCVFMIFLTC